MSVPSGNPSEPWRARSRHVQTVTGPIDPASLGVTLTHEHVFLTMWCCDGHGYVGQTSDEDVLAAELSAFREAGGSCLVDQTPGGAGRDPAGLVRLSERTGVAIVTGCGWYTEPYYPPAADLVRRPADDIAAELIREISDGLDGTDVRPGMIGEIGASQGWVSPVEERVHRAAARAQRATGLPLATHTLYHSAGIQQMRIFDEEGVDPARVCIGHCDTFPDLDYCLTVARWGGYVSLDNIGFQLGEHEERVRRLLLGLLDHGMAERVLLSQDVGQVPELRSSGGRGYTYLAETFIPSLGAGDDVLHTLTVDNPRRWLTVA